jgi:hypothetical protein
MVFTSLVSSATTDDCQSSALANRKPLWFNSVRFVSILYIMVQNGANYIMSKKKNINAITIRFSDEVYAWLVETAKREKRSLNAQVSLLVERAYEQAQPTPPAPGQ